MHERGFTLLEAIIAIVITGIVAGMVAVFIARPIEGYQASVRRAGLTDMADLALKRMALEIRTAVPNSVRVASSGGSYYLEFVPALDGGRYCTNTDTDPACTSNPLLFDGNDTSFATLGPAPAGADDDWLVIFNTGQPGLNAYAAPGATTNRRQLNAPVGSTVSFDTPGYTYASPSGRFQIVENNGASNKGPVTFACESPVVSGGGALRRYTGYGFNPTQLTIGLGTGALLVDGVAACTFTYGPVSASNGLVSLRLTLTREGESVTLMHQIHVDNIP